MAIDILNQIKSAEAQADEIRRAASLAAKDALKAAAKECEQLEDTMLTQARRTNLEKVDKAKHKVYAELDAQKQKRQLKCNELKAAALKKLEKAADICIEGLL